MTLIAIPLTENDTFSSHFGGASKAGLFEVDPAKRTITNGIFVQPPEPEPCGWAAWLAARGVKVILSGGMGRGAQQRMAELGIQVVTGVPEAPPRTLVQAWLDGNLATGANACEGGHHHHDGHGHHHHHGDCGCSH